MRVVQATPATRWTMPTRPITTGRAARIERLALVVTSAVACLGLWLVYSEQVRTATSCSALSVGAASGSTPRRPAPSGPGSTSQSACLNLTTLTQAADLAPALTMFSEPAERTAVARAILARLSGPNAEPLTRVRRRCAQPARKTW